MHADSISLPIEISASPEREDFHATISFLRDFFFPIRFLVVTWMQHCSSFSLTYRERGRVMQKRASVADNQNRLFFSCCLVCDAEILVLTFFTLISFAQRYAWAVILLVNILDLE